MTDPDDIARITELEEENRTLVALLWLASKEIIHLFDEAPGKKWGFAVSVIVNDTFAWACADCEEIEEWQAPEIADVYLKWGWDGVVAWCAIKRDCDPIKPLRTKMYKQARRALEGE